MPAPSTWKTPATSPRLSMFKQCFGPFRWIWPDVTNVVRNVVHLVLCAVTFFDEPRGRAQDGQRAQPEEIDFEQTNRFDDFHRPLRDAIDAAQTFCTRCGFIERHVFDQWFVGDDHAGRVAGCVTADAFELLRRVDQFLCLRVSLIQIDEFCTVEFVILLQTDRQF